MNEYIFVISMVVVIFNIFKVVSVITGNVLSLPFDKSLFGITQFYFSYPAFGVVIWVFSKHFGVI